MYDQSYIYLCMNLETSTDKEPIVIYVSDVDLAEQTLYTTGIHIYMA